ncbi:MAG: MaoC family dehydratase [Bacteroidota bacterium]
MTFKNLAELNTVIGKEIGPSEWVTVTQEMINSFAVATLDNQWIHTDIEKAKAHSPFGEPIAHGFLSLSLISHFVGELIHVESAKMGVNYGLNKVRFTSHVPSGAKVRMKATLGAVEPYAENGVKMTINGIMELEGSDKPVCIAEFIALTFE